MARDVEMYDENILLDYPPDHVTIGDTEYRINSDFRVSILFELLISDPEVPDDRKLLQALRLYYGDDIPTDIPEAIRMIKWFYGGGKKLKDEENKAEDEEEKASAEPPSFSFEHDAPYIYSAFLQQYGIDLVEEDLHWWKFRALLVSLTEDCKFVKIVKETAPNVQMILCTGGIEDPNATEILMEKEFAQSVRDTDIWSVDKYMALHWGWPFDVALKTSENRTFKRDTVENTYKLTKMKSFLPVRVKIRSRRIVQVQNHACGGMT